MAVDRVTRTTEQGWGSRLGGSIKGILVGLVMAVVGVILLFYGEGRAVRRAQALSEGEKSAVSISAAGIDPTFEGRLVHFSARATSEEVLRDPDLGESTDGLKLYRKVEMYQWREHQEQKTEKKLGGGERTITTYTYDKGWEDEEIDASSFEEPDGHQNPSLPIHSATWVAEPIRAGVFELGEAFVSQIDRTRSIEPSSADRPAELAGRGVRLYQGKLYLGADPSRPEVGDVRIAFEEVPELDVSVVGAQRGGRIEPYSTSNEQSLSLLEQEVMPVERMFEQAKAANSALTWLLRAAGFLLLLFGFSLLLRPLRVVADVVPFAGRLVGAGLGVVAFLAAALVSLVTIAVGWIFYRPLLGVSLLLLAGVFAVWLVKRLRARRPPGMPPPPPPHAAPPPLPPLPPPPAP